MYFDEKIKHYDREFVIHSIKSQQKDYTNNKKIEKYKKKIYHKLYDKDTLNKIKKLTAHGYRSCELFYVRPKHYQMIDTAMCRILDLVQPYSLKLVPRGKYYVIVVSWNRVTNSYL